MEKFKRFEEIVKRNNYIFHIHTVFTDGKNTVDEYYKVFGKSKLLIFTEHIRKSPNYNWKQYIEIVKNFDYLAGFEAKVLPGGDLNIPLEALDKIDVLAIAVHSFEGSFLDLKRSLKEVFRKYIEFDIPLIWVHPASIEYKKFNFDKLEYIEDISEEYKDRLYIEMNYKWKNLTDEEFKYLKKSGYKLINGFDAHSVDDILNSPFYLP